MIRRQMTSRVQHPVFALEDGQYDPWMCHRLHPDDCPALASIPLRLIMEQRLLENMTEKDLTSLLAQIPQAFTHSHFEQRKAWRIHCESAGKVTSSNAVFLTLSDSGEAFLEALPNTAGPYLFYCLQHLIEVLQKAITKHQRSVL